MNEFQTPIPPPASSPAWQPRIDRGTPRVPQRLTRRLAAWALGTTMLGVGLSAAMVDAAPSSARQIERRALDTASATGSESQRPVEVDEAGDADVVIRPEVLRIECAAPAAVAGQRVRVGCTWTLPNRSPVRQLTLWRLVDGGVRERVATFGWPFENSYRDVVPAGTSRVTYAVIGTDGAGDLVARSRADVVRLPTLPKPIAAAPSEPTPRAAAPVPVDPPSAHTAPARTFVASDSVPTVPPHGNDAIRPAPSTAPEPDELTVSSPQEIEPSTSARTEPAQGAKMDGATERRGDQG